MLSLSSGKHKFQRFAPSVKMSASTLFLMFVIHCFVFLPFILTTVWVYVFDEMGPGLGLHGKQLFNWHPVLMTLGFGAIMAEGTMSYWLYSPHSTAKLIHGVCLFMMLLIGTIGFSVVVAFHKEIKAPHFYSVHSWLGLANFGLAWVQFFFGLTFFGNFIYVPQKWKDFLIVYHRGLGRVLVASSTATMAAGLMQKQSFIRSINPWSPVLIMANVIGIAVFMSAICVFQFLARPKYEQPKEKTVSSDLPELREELAAPSTAAQTNQFFASAAAAAESVSDLKDR